MEWGNILIIFGLALLLVCLIIIYKIVHDDDEDSSVGDLHVVKKDDGSYIYYLALDENSIDKIRISRNVTFNVVMHRDDK